jgi:tetratricopeptide (TPR) repeat protein
MVDLLRYRDFNLHVELAFSNDREPTIEQRHTVEIQVHLRPVKEYADANDGHAEYEYFRAYYAGSMHTVAVRLDALKNILAWTTAPTSSHAAAFKSAVSAAAKVSEAEVATAKEAQGAIALKQIATDVFLSRDPVRLRALSSLAKEHLIEFQLATFISEEVLRLRMASSAGNHGGSAGGGSGSGNAAEEEYSDPKVNIASAKYEIANILSDQGDHAKAFVLYEETLAIFTEALGGEHIEVGRVLNNMCAIRLFQRKFDEAKVLCTRALSIQKAVLGPDDLLVGQVTSNLGTCMLALGELDEALELFEWAKTIQSAVSGADDPDVGGALNNIAMVHRRKGNLDAALALYHEALAIQTGALGPDHPCCGRTKNNMALLLHQQGKLDESLLLYRQALAVSTAALGGGHWEVAGTLANIGDVLKKQHKFGEALQAYKDAFAIQVGGYGEEDPKSSMYLFFYAGVLLHIGYADQQQPSKHVDAAFAAYARLLATKERVLGTDDPAVAEIVDKMACIKGNGGHFEEANALFARAHPVYLTHYGEGHSLTVAAANNMAATARAMSAAAASNSGAGAGVAAAGADTTETVERRFQMHSVVFLAMAVAEANDRLATNAGVLLASTAGGRQPSSFTDTKRVAASRWRGAALSSPL